MAATIVAAKSGVLRLFVHCEVSSGWLEMQVEEAGATNLLLSVRLVDSLTYKRRLLLTLHRTLPGGPMAIHDLPKKWRDRAHGDAAMLACADELEAHLKDTALCYVSGGTGIHLDLILPDAVFIATITRPSSCTLSTKSGDTRRATLVFD